jgi:hypothetical protein
MECSKGDFSGEVVGPGGGDGRTREEVGQRGVTWVTLAFRGPSYSNGGGGREGQVVRSGQ